MVQIDAKVLATLSWPRSMSIVYTFRLSDSAQLKSRSPQNPELAYKKLDQDKAKTKGQKKSLDYITAIFFRIRFWLLFFSLKWKMPQVSY